MPKILLNGIGVSKGTVEGTLRIILGRDEFKNFNEDEILVTKITDPSYVSLMTKAKAVVTDIGGITSHPAIVSRELGIPCVVNTKNATKTLKDGQKIKVDGTKGIIYGEE
jgi:pyruvate,water dikinase